MAKGRDRDRRREERWRRIVVEQERSGLSIRGFCRKRRLRESAFYFWRRELQRRQAEPQHRGPEQGQQPGEDSPASPAFVAVRLSGPQLSAGPVEDGGGVVAIGRIIIELAGGRRVHLAGPVDRRALADVLAVLRLDALAASRPVEAEGPPC